MKTITISIFVLLSVNGFGQTEIMKCNISSTGGTSSNGTVSIVYTAGEFAVQENTQGTVHISEGFISPEMLIASEIKDYSQTDFNVTLFPNPAADFVNIEFSTVNDYQIKLLDIQGKVLFETEGSGNLKRIPLHHLSNGNYLLLVKNLNDKQYKVFKLIKN